MTAPADDRYRTALAQLWERSNYDRGFISNPFAGEQGARLGLLRTAGILDRLGHPDRRYPILHVAGSKGKGSTCAFASAILIAAGRRTGLYTSPHLHSFRERIAIDGEPIDEGAFAEGWRRTYSAALAMETEAPELGRATAFELATAMAFDSFARAGCDAAVVEVGLGGTYDATNVVHPASTAIAALDFEHTHVLGTTMAEIAVNKAGIVKPGVPLATAALPAEAMTVVASAVARAGASWLRAGIDWRWSGSWRSFSLAGPWGRFEGLRSGLMGAHQVENAGLAVAALLPMPGTELTETVVRAGIAATRLPGRFEVVERQGRTVILDGAHTPASARILAAAVAAEFPNRQATVILGVLRDKDPVAIWRELKPIARRVIAVSPGTPRALPAAKLAEDLTAARCAVESIPAVGPALKSARDELVLVTGSLSTVAAAREALGLAVPDRLQS